MLICGNPCLYVDIYAYMLKSMLICGNPCLYARFKTVSYKAFYRINHEEDIVGFLSLQDVNSLVFLSCFCRINLQVILTKINKLKDRKKTK